MATPERTVLQFIKPAGIGKERIFQAESRKTLLLRGGWEGNKYRIFLYNRKHEQKPLVMFAKDINVSAGKDRAKNELIDIAKSYGTLNAKGYPVPRTARVFEDVDGWNLLLSDMTENDTYYIWGWNDEPSQQDYEVLKAMDLSDKDLKIIHQLAKNLARQGAIDDINFFKYYYHPRKHKQTGKVDVILLDIADKLNLKPLGYHLDNWGYLDEFMEKLKSEVKKVRQRQ